MHPSLRQTAHRPWPLPPTAWRWRQSWLDLVFIHQRVAPERLRSSLPAGLRLQTFDGSAWIGIVPFRMARVAPRLLGPLPLLPDFPEINLRTYVEYKGKPGVWFFSLDATSLAVVFGGRHFYGLPYFRAEISQTFSGNAEMTFTSVRRKSPVRFQARCIPKGEPFHARPGTFEHWATERYCLYSAGARGELTCVEVHHAPWPLRSAEVQINANDLLKAAGIVPENDELVGHFSPGVDVISFKPTPV